VLFTCRIEKSRAYKTSPRCLARALSAKKLRYTLWVNWESKIETLAELAQRFVDSPHFPSGD